MITSNRANPDSAYKNLATFFLLASLPTATPALIHTGRCWLQAKYIEIPDV